MQPTRISHSCRILLVLLCLLIAPGAVASATETVDRIVAIVNDDIIRAKELEEAYRRFSEQRSPADALAGKAQERFYEQRNEVLNLLINRTLADQVIESEGLSVSSAEIDNAIEQVKSMNYYTDEDLRQSLRMNGMDMDTYREEIRHQILQSKLVNRKVKSSVVITDADIREYYESHPEKYQEQPQYRLKNIFMALEDPSSPDEREKLRKRMDQAMAELDEGKSFESVAGKYSEGSNASKGGELGNFALDDLQKELQSVIKILSPGDISDIVETDQGFQIFYLEDIVQPSNASLESVSREIRELLYQQAVDKKYQGWIETLREEAHIQIIR